MKEAIYQLRNIWKIYKVGGKEVHALRNINLDIRRGEFLCVLGPSGSGKSTLLHILGFLDKPTKGSILFKGVDVSKLNSLEMALLRRKKIGFVFQQFYLFPNLNVIENVEIALAINEADRDKRMKIIKRILKKVGLWERRYHYPSQLSGGEQQRVAIARALANNPDIIIADEPTGNLDSKTGKKIVSIFKKLNDEGKTIIIATHDLSIANLSKRIIKLKDGEIIEDTYLY